MKFKSVFFSQASGSLAGSVFSRNNGGMYVRARALPTNPASEPQQAVRDGVKWANDAWTNVLTSAQREAWNSYAFNTPTINRLGEPTTKTGQNMFLRTNVILQQAGLTPKIAAPTIFDLGDFTTPSNIIADASAGTIAFDYGDDDAWVQNTGGYLFVFQSRPQNQTRTFSKGPNLLATVVSGNTTTPPASPAVFNAMYPMTVGQRVFLRFTCQQVDGRYSSQKMLSVIVTA